MLRSVLLRAVFFSLLLMTSFSSANAVPMVLSHQGRLLDASDAPLSGTFTIVYSIYDAPVGGTQLWMEDHVGVVVTDGLFSVELGSVVPLTADIVAGSGGGGGGGGGSLRYLQVQLSGQPPIMPRTALVSSPYSIATERVSGDFRSGPGIIVIGDTTTSGYATFGEKVNAGLQSAGSALSQGASLLRQQCDDTDADYLMRHSHGVFANMLHMHARTDSVGLSSSYADATVETGMDHSSTTDGSSFSMSTKDNMPNRISMNVTVPKSTSGHFGLSVDLGDDGVEDNSVDLTSDLTSARLAIKTKGTGADANRVLAIQNGATPTSLSSISSIDDDGDTVPESEFSQIVTPGTCSVAINTKGTGADKGRIISTTYPDSAILIMYSDLTSSSSGTREINHRNLPSASIVSIRAEDLGGTQSQSVTAVYPDSTVTVQESDSDGDGISEAKAVSSVGNLAGAGGGAAAASYARMISDGDDDGLPEGDISQSVTPTTCSVAIKTKGTGADANRSALLSSTTEVGDVSTVSSLDEDGDGLSESSISQHIAPTTSSLAIKTKGVPVQRTQTISGDCDDQSSVLSLGTDDDGDGISDSKVVVASGASLLGGALPGGAIISSRYDSDDDGVAEQEIDQIVTPTTSSVAIKTKGTGADKNRVIGSTDDTTATMLMATDSTSISMRVRKGGVIKGAININHASFRQVEFDSDGKGYLSSAIGIGVDPTHHIDVAGGAYCDGTNWVNASDRNSKENFEKVDGEEILEKISDLEITKWNYKGDEDAQHIGPTAQDFKKTFGVGADDKSISTIDPSGIALAAIKELYAQLKQKDQKLDDQAKLILELQEKLSSIEKQLKKQ